MSEVKTKTHTLQTGKHTVVTGFTLHCKIKATHAAKLASNSSYDQ